MARHPLRQVFATGQTDPKGKEKPYVCVWEDTGEHIAYLGRMDYHDRAVAVMAFSADGQFLATIGDDSDHTMCLWEWKKAQLMDSGVM